jgi:hypothetical protein
MPTEPDSIPEPTGPTIPEPSEPTHEKPPQDFPEIPKPQLPETPFPVHPEPTPGEKPGPLPQPKDLSGLRLRFELDLYPAGLPLVERFVRLDGVGHRLGLGQHLQRVDLPCNHCLDQTRDVLPVRAVAHL